MHSRGKQVSFMDLWKLQRTLCFFKIQPVSAHPLHARQDLLSQVAVCCFSATERQPGPSHWTLTQNLPQVTAMLPRNATDKSSRLKRVQHCRILDLSFSCSNSRHNRAKCQALSSHQSVDREAPSLPKVVCRGTHERIDALWRTNAALKVTHKVHSCHVRCLLQVPQTRTSPRHSWLPRLRATSVSRCLQIRITIRTIGSRNRPFTRCTQSWTPWRSPLRPWHPQVDRSSLDWHLLASQALRLAECLLPRRSRIQLPSEPRMKHCNNMQQIQTIFQRQDNQVVGNESETRGLGFRVWPCCSGTLLQPRNFWKLTSAARGRTFAELQACPAYHANAQELLGGIHSCYATWHQLALTSHRFLANESLALLILKDIESNTTYSEMARNCCALQKGCALWLKCSNAERISGDLRRSQAKLPSSRIVNSRPSWSKLEQLAITSIRQSEENEQELNRNWRSSRSSRSGISAALSPTLVFWCLGFLGSSGTNCKSGFVATRLSGG